VFTTRPELVGTYGMVASTHWLAFFPGMAIFFAVLGFNLLGDGVREAREPRSREEQPWQA
jgi:ABC-type dipeptide/oligopeptide/nickel transport system permease subunit